MAKFCKFTVALSECTRLEEVHSIFKTLSSWLQYDVLQLAGHPPIERAMLYDFIVSEMTILASRHAHRIKDILITLNAQRGALLDVASTLNEKFSVLETQYDLSIDIIWDICYLAR
ncbi:MAG: hypothetical protein P1U39_08640 [Legionellaceae bacterium]|nr:hypothetical protein [Legionellaceae bacterium]